MEITWWWILGPDESDRNRFIRDILTDNIGGFSAIASIQVPLESRRALDKLWRMRRDLVLSSFQNVSRERLEASLLAQIKTGGGPPNRIIPWRVKDNKETDLFRRGHVWETPFIQHVFLRLASSLQDSDQEVAIDKFVGTFLAPKRKRAIIIEGV